ncbi:MAG TPA: rhodanese-like domain-containing protein [Steroidobacteraceae bacterium]|nr:rhodanese-like domain-containing protein [Steroidobacteraceae bacterium]
MDRLVEYVGHHPWYVAGALAAAILVMIYELRKRKESFAAVSPQDLVRLMNQGALVIDLRPAEAFASGHLAGARHMSGEQVLKAGDTLKKHKEKTVVVYDDTGSLSASAVRQLASQGFTRAFNLRGGLAAWRAENLPLSKA